MRMITALYLFESGKKKRPSISLKQDLNHVISTHWKSKFVFHMQKKSQNLETKKVSNFLIVQSTMDRDN